MASAMANDDETECALNILRKIRLQVAENNDKEKLRKLDHLITVLESPLYTQLVTVGLSLDELAAIQEGATLEKDDFGILPETGQLWLTDAAREKREVALRTREMELLTAQEGRMSQSGRVSLRARNRLSPEEFQARVTRLANGREPVHAELNRAEGEPSYGFSVIGLRGEKSDSLGVYIHYVVPDGIAERQGDIHSGDQVLAIDGVPLDEESCQEDAVHLLKAAGDRVELVLAASSIPQSRLLTGVSLSLDGDLNVTDGGGKSNEDPSWSAPPIGVVVATGRQKGPPVPTRDYSLDDMLNTEWTQYEIIDLLNDGTGLGFGIIGSRTTGVVVRTILPGGVADRDGRLRTKDHIMYIGQVNVRAMSSEQVAAVLRNSGVQSRLIVARPFDPNTTEEAPSGSSVAIVETTQLEGQLEMIVRRMYTDSPPFIEPIEEQSELNLSPEQTDMLYMQTPSQPSLMTPDQGDVDIFSVELVKGQTGLGITIAGYVSAVPGGSLKGIFVKQIAPGSAAANDGSIQMNDKIIEVDDIPLDGLDNQQAVEILRNTRDIVRLKLARYQSGPIYEQLLENTRREQFADIPVGPVSMEEEQESFDEESMKPAFAIETTIRYEREEDTQFKGPLDSEVERELKERWSRELGPGYDIVVAQLSTLSDKSGLGIGLEGTVDVEENGLEVRPHHYISSIVEDGPVGKNHVLKKKDELLEVNGRTLYGLNPLDVVAILKALPRDVRLVCARPHHPAHVNRLHEPIRKGNIDIVLYHPKSSDEEEDSNSDISDITEEDLLGRLPNGKGAVAWSTQYPVKARSEERLWTEEDTGLLRSQSLMDGTEGVALWSASPLVVGLEKGERGLGFSVLDYQDPVNPLKSVIVIRSLVPGGLADLDGRIVPGDRLLFVNEISLDGADLKGAVEALKSAPRGKVVLGIAKALPMEDSNFMGQQRANEEDPQFVLDLLNHQKSLDLNSPDVLNAAGGLFAQLPPVPTALEQKIRLKKLSGEGIGFDIETPETGPNGYLIKNLQHESPLDRDGRVTVGDFVTGVSGESLRNVSQVHAKAILRRVTLMAGEVSIAFIPGSDAQVHLQTSLMAVRAEGHPLGGLHPNPHHLTSTKYMDYGEEAQC